MKLKLAIALVLLTALAGVTQAQQIYCYTSGNQTYCNQQRNSYEDGRQIGQGIGAAIAVGIARAEVRRAERFCLANPGQQYHDVTCPSAEQAAFNVAAVWAKDHPKFHQSQANAEVMTAYLSSNQLDLRIYKNYDKAFKALKKDGKLEFNK
jgi:hypothetical protein